MDDRGAALSLASGEARTERVLSVAALVRGLSLGLILGRVAPWGAGVLGAADVDSSFVWMRPALQLTFGAGTLGGAALASLLSRRLGRRPTVSVGLALASLGAFVFALAPASFLVGAGVVGGALLVVVLPLEIPAMAWLRESIAAHRRAPVVGGLLAFLGLGMLLGLSLAAVADLAPNGAGWLRAAWLLLGVGFVAAAVAVFRTRTDPPAAMGLALALDLRRVAGWLRATPDGSHPARGVMLGISCTLAAAFLHVPALSSGRGGGESALSVALAAVALVLVRRLGEGRPAWFVIAVLSLASGLLAADLGGSSSLALWLLGVSLCLIFGPTHLLLALPEAHRTDLPGVFVLILGGAVGLAGILGILGQESFVIINVCAAVLAFAGLSIWGWTTRSACY